jgi:hypothetical protein
VLFNLPYDITLDNLTSVIRGGKILRIVLIYNHVGVVTFLATSCEEANFWTNFKQNGLIINGREIRVERARKEPSIPKSAVQKASRFHTRNILLRRCAGKCTEEQIRDHLGHIYNLEVIKIRCHHGNIIIGTNSVQYANTARDCMSSRKEYMGVSFDWADDECDGPLTPVVRSNPPKSRRRDAIHTRVVTANIFEILDLDTNFGSETGEEIGF